jgi:hypothetical protein
MQEVRKFTKNVKFGIIKSKFHCIYIVSQQALSMKISNHVFSPRLSSSFKQVTLEYPNYAKQMV